MKKILLVLLCAMSFASAAGIKWSGGAAVDSFSAGGNWVGGVAPGTNDTAIFDSASSNKNCLVGSGVTVRALTFGNYSGTFNHTGGIVVSSNINRTLLSNTGKVNITGTGAAGITIQLASNKIDTIDNIRAASGSSSTWLFRIVTGSGNGWKLYLKNLINPSAIATIGAGTATASTGQFIFIGDTVRWSKINMRNTATTNVDSVYFGSKIFDIGSGGLDFNTSAGGKSYKFFDAATIYCAGNVVRAGVDSLAITNVGTSKFVFDSTTNTVLSNLRGTQNFYNIEVKKDGAAKCSTATATDTINCNEMRVTSGKLNIIAPLYCNSYLNLSTDTSFMRADKYINTSFYRASTTNASADTFKTYFITNVNHDISCDTNITLGRFIVSEGRATALTNLRMVKFTLPVASKLTIANGKIFVVDSTYDIEGSSGNLDSVVSATGSTLKLPAADTVSYVYFKNITSVNPIYAPVANGNIDGGGNVNINFGIDTVPSITSITPAHGTFGTAVTVSGTTFGSSPSGYLNGGLVPYVSRDSISYVFNATDLGLFGVVPFVIKNNTYNTYDTINWSYDTVPNLSSVNLAYGRKAGGDTRIIYGTGMTGVDTVWIGANKATITAKTDNSVTVTTPASSTSGTFGIRTFAEYGYKDTLISSFTYDVIHGLAISPSSQKDTLAGVDIAITASYGLTGTSLTATSPFDSYTVLTDSTATAKSLAKSKGSYPVRVYKATDSSNTVYYRFREPSEGSGNITIDRKIRTKVGVRAKIGFFREEEIMLYEESFESR